MQFAGPVAYWSPTRTRLFVSQVGRSAIFEHEVAIDQGWACRDLQPPRNVEVTYSQVTRRTNWRRERIVRVMGGQVQRVSFKLAVLKERALACSCPWFVFG